jgi:hypothetical protein
MVRGIAVVIALVFAWPASARAADVNVDANGVLHYAGSPGKRSNVRFTELAADVEGDSLALRPHLTRVGNGAYLGTLRAVLRDPAGRVVASLASPLAVYYDMSPRLTAPLPAAGLPAGTYRVEVEAAAEREDIAPDLVLASPPERSSLAVRLP